MGWFFGSSSSSEGKDSPTPSTSKDPIASLEPSLREYLQSQYTKSRTTSSSNSSNNPSPSPTPPPTNPSSYGTRYSHLWTTYQPPHATATPATEQEALTTIMRAHRTRKTQLTRAALENCSEMQLALHECYRGGGGLKGRLTNCSKQAKQLDDCYSTQVKLLRALGYMAEVGREKDVEERIQMHADRLYREKLGEERVVEERVGRRRREGEGKEGGEEVAVVEEGWLQTLKAGWGPKRGEEGIGRTKMGGVEIVIEPTRKEGGGEGEEKR